MDTLAGIDPELPVVADAGDGEHLVAVDLVLDAAVSDFPNEGDPAMDVVLLRPLEEAILFAVEEADDEDSDEETDGTDGGITTFAIDVQFLVEADDEDTAIAVADSLMGYREVQQVPEEVVTSLATGVVVAPMDEVHGGPDDGALSFDPNAVRTFETGAAAGRYQFLFGDRLEDAYEVHRDWAAAEEGEAAGASGPSTKDDWTMEELDEKGNG